MKPRAYTWVAVASLLVAAVGFTVPRASSDDESVFVKGLGPDDRESILYVWTRDADGQDSDFLTVVDVDPRSPTYGQVIGTAPTNSAGNEAHHFGYTANTDRIFGAGLFTNRMFIYDLEADPRNPNLIRTVDLDPTGYSGPHTMYAIPGGMMVAMLGATDGGGPGGLVLLDNDGDFVRAYPAGSHSGSPIFMYDVGVKLELNRMVTSSFAHPQHVKMDGGAPPDHVGRTVVVWDWETKEILQLEELDAAPLEVRWMHGPDGLGGFINCAYASTVWYWQDSDGDGTLEFTRVMELDEGATPADMRISYDNRFLYVSLWGRNQVHQYDITNPFEPRFVSAVEIPQPTMMKLSPDSRRLYVTNSMLSTMDGDVEFGAWLFDVGPDGMNRDERFAPDFNSFPTGPAGPHDMLLK